MADHHCFFTDSYVLNKHVIHWLYIDSLTIKIWLLFKSQHQRYFWGVGPPNLGRVCCSMGPRQLMLYCILRKNVRKFGACVVLLDPIYLEISAKYSIHFRIFFQKSIFYASKQSHMEKNLKSFDEITYMTPPRPFSDNFENFEKF